eukprot:TRINITY_DN3965_c0_g1_i2.p1 TRINITY_DN3965_c0_g1~~TRINITY_DN3965_c0_g1_i2.p1  ORF type:complete len:160 (-),score=38.43 TRINITY_DN3965_c0_g1_i2:225-704(-)
MPLPKYYCDYCDRTFNDAPSTRQKHFESHFHQLQVKYHYDSFRDPNNPYPELQLVICPALLRTGQCNFPSGCRYSHTTGLPPFEKVEKSSDPFSQLLPSTSATLAKQTSLPSHLQKFVEKAASSATIPTPILPPNAPPSCQPPPNGGWGIDPNQVGTWG